MISNMAESIWVKLSGIIEDSWKLTPARLAPLGENTARFAHAEFPSSQTTIVTPIVSEKSDHRQLGKNTFYTLAAPPGGRSGHHLVAW